jgi:hypothetical protein
VKVCGLNRCEYVGSDASATRSASTTPRFGLLLVFIHFDTNHPELMFS